ncbi:MAG: hypothetical protein ACYDA7_07290 [Acidithiobacillus sp.]|nr:hypothetical protein [Acidithiobacillus ferruginosus]MBU2813840.1 hypothetical protein [Acidithiobacillus ferruginosus]
MTPEKGNVHTDNDYGQHNNVTGYDQSLCHRGVPSGAGIAKRRKMARLIIKPEIFAGVRNILDEVFALRFWVNLRKIMRFFKHRQKNIRMFLEVAIQGSGAAFDGAGNEEIGPPG